MACLCIDKVIHVDHIKPRSTFPQLEMDINNLQILCVDCNMGNPNGLELAGMTDEAYKSVEEWKN